MTGSAVSLVARAQDAEMCIRRYLDARGRGVRRFWPDHPVRTKNLEKIIGHLQNLLPYLPAEDPRLDALLQQLQNPETMAFDTAWEISDLLDLESLRLVNDTSLNMLLNGQKTPQPNDGHSWDHHFPREYLDTLLQDFHDGRFKHDHVRLEARAALYRIQESRVEEYRVDRAKARLRGIYLSIMAALLAVLIGGVAYYYLLALREPTNRADGLLLALTMLSGAAGSVLSRAIKLGKQPLHGEPGPQHSETPLGIRALLSDWKVFLVQPVLGATAALVVYFVFSTGLLRLGDKPELGPEGFALVGFLAGFSEPFFLGILDQVTSRGGSPV